MALKSMTGFARCDGSDGPLLWHWEARTLNARGLDVRLRLPNGFEALEAKVRAMCKAKFSRGNCTVNLIIKRNQEGGRLRLNEGALQDVAGIVERARGLVKAAEPSLDALLALKGVVEFTEEDESGGDEARLELLLTDLATTLDGVETSRKGEGEHLEAAIAGHIDEIEKLVNAIAASPSRTTEAILARLESQIAQLVEGSHEFDQQRLHQEAVLLATKADIAEELDRLQAHIASARALLAMDEPVGRRFDFLTQEFNREANTICSKSNDSDVTKTGLELKTVIDRLREQVQNVE